jgi:hypothetical protein
MKYVRYFSNGLIAAFIASLLLSGCGKSDSNAPAQAATGPSRPAQTAKADKKLQRYRRAKKIYNGQTVYLLEMDDFPLRDVPLATIRENAEAGDPAAEYELGRRIGIGEGVEQDFQESFQWIKKAAKHNNPDAQFELGLTFSLGALSARKSNKTMPTPCIGLKKRRSRALAPARTDSASSTAKGEACHRTRVRPWNGFTKRRNRTTSKL